MKHWLIRFGILLACCGVFATQPIRAQEEPGVLQILGVQVDGSTVRVVFYVLDSHGAPQASPQLSGASLIINQNGQSTSYRTSVRQASTKQPLSAVFMVDVGARLYNSERLRRDYLTDALDTFDAAGDQVGLVTLEDQIRNEQKLQAVASLKNALKSALTSSYNRQPPCTLDALAHSITLAQGAVSKGATSQALVVAITDGLNTGSNCTITDFASVSATAQKGHTPVYVLTVGLPGPESLRNLQSLALDTGGGYIGQLEGSAVSLPSLGEVLAPVRFPFIAEIKDVSQTGSAAVILQVGGAQSTPTTIQLANPVNSADNSSTQPAVESTVAPALSVLSSPMPVPTTTLEPISGVRPEIVSVPTASNTNNTLILGIGGGVVMLGLMTVILGLVAVRGSRRPALDIDPEPAFLSFFYCGKEIGTISVKPSCLKEGIIIGRSPDYYDGAEPSVEDDGERINLTVGEISSNHVRLRFDPHKKANVVMDVQSANGTSLIRQDKVQPVSQKPIRLIKQDTLILAPGSRKETKIVYNGFTGTIVIRSSSQDGAAPVPYRATMVVPNQNLDDETPDE